MSLNSSKMRRSIQQAQGYKHTGSGAADFISTIFFITLNVIAVVGEFTSVFSHLGITKKGIAFLYSTVCFPVVAFFSKFFPLSGTVPYKWVVAEAVFFATSFIAWLVILFVVRLFKSN